MKSFLISLWRVNLKGKDIKYLLDIGKDEVALDLIAISLLSTFYRFLKRELNQEPL